jgi:hypothetical protein
VVECVFYEYLIQNFINSCEDTQTLLGILKLGHSYFSDTLGFCLKKFMVSDNVNTIFSN